MVKKVVKRVRKRSYKSVKKRSKWIKTEEKPAMSIIEIIFGIVRFLSEAAFALRDLVNQHSSGCQNRSIGHVEKGQVWQEGRIWQ